MRYNTIEFDIIKYNFKEIIEDLYITDSLENIHTLTTNKYEKLFEVGMDSSTVFHEIFYNQYRAGFRYLNEQERLRAI